MNPRDQIPAPGDYVLDHIGFFVPDMDKGSAALERLGFFLTPWTPQQHSLGPGQPVVPAGTGNRLALLERGYIELLSPHAEGPVADQMRDALRRYIGLHLIALGTADAAADHARIAAAGFATVPLVNLQRKLDTPRGPGMVRFSVARVPPTTMPEGRIQFCQHLTPENLWQERWLTRANGARQLTDIVLCVADPNEAAQRYGRFFSRPPRRLPAGGWSLDLKHGRAVILSPDRLAAVLPGIAVPTLPFMAAFAVTVADLSTVRALLAAKGVATLLDTADTVAAASLPELGAVAVFLAGDGRAPWLDGEPGG